MPVIGVMPVIDVIAVGRPLIDLLAVGLVIAVDVMDDGSALTVRSAAGVIIVVVGIMVFMPMLFMPMECCVVIMGIMVVFMPMERCMFIMGIVLVMGMERCMFIMGIIILGAPPGGLAAALSRSPKRAHVARTMRAAVENVRNIAFLLPNGA